MEASCRSKPRLQEALLAAASGFPHGSRCSFIGRVGVASGPGVLEEAAVFIFLEYLLNVNTGQRSDLIWPLIHLSITIKVGMRGAPGWLSQ